MRLQILLASAALLVAAPAHAAGLPADLAQAVRAYDLAQQKGDRAALERLLADDYLLANSGGQVEAKAQFIGELTDPAYRLDPFVVEEPVERVWADGAVMGGVAELKGADHGQAFDVRLRFADVWARRGGRWQVVYTQAARAPAKP